MLKLNPFQALVLQTNGLKITCLLNKHIFADWWSHAKYSILRTQIAQHLKVSIRQFLHAGDPALLNISNIKRWCTQTIGLQFGK